MQTLLLYHRSGPSDSCLKAGRAEEGLLALGMGPSYQGTGAWKTQGPHPPLEANCIPVPHPTPSLFFRTHLQDLKEVTHNIHYETYRAKRLNDNGGLPPVSTDTEASRDSNP